MEELTDVSQCRPAVRRFAVAMEKKLRENDEKGGWDDCSFDYLKNRLIMEYNEYTDEMRVYLNAQVNRSTTAEEMRVFARRVREETADIANFAMMIFDNLYTEHEGNKDTKNTISGDISQKGRQLKRYELIDILVMLL